MDAYILKSTNHQDAASIKKRYTIQYKLRNGVNVIFRPIECSDQARFKDFFKSLSALSVHLRFFEIIKELPNETVERFCDLDYSQEIAIVAEPLGEGRIVAVARLVIESTEKRGEFALVVADVWQGLGLGAELLDYIIIITRDYGLDELHCFVSSDNPRMIRLSEKRGLKVKSAGGEVVEMRLKLS